MFPFGFGTIDVGYFIEVWLLTVLTFYFSHSIADRLRSVFANLNCKWNWACLACFSYFFDTSSDLDDFIHWICSNVRFYKCTRCLFAIYFRYRVAICFLTLLTCLDNLGCSCWKLIWKLFESIVVDWLCLIYKLSCFHDRCRIPDTNDTVDCICNFVFRNDGTTDFFTISIAYQEGADNLSWTSFFIDNTFSCWKCIVWDINRLEWNINLFIHCTFCHLRSTDYCDFINSFWIFDFWDFLTRNFDIVLIGNFISCCDGTWWADLSDLAVAFWLGFIFFNNLVEVFFFDNYYGSDWYNHT